MNIKEDYHVHSNYNDHSENNLTIENAIRYATNMGLMTIAFTEHVRKNSKWIAQYLEEIRFFSNRCPSVKVIPGFEAKILRDGTIDCPPEYSSRYFLIASFHTTFGSKELWINALREAIDNPSVDVIGHLAPESTFGLSTDEINLLARELVRNNKVVELNAKYHRPPNDWIISFKRRGVRFHLGSDAHTLEEIGKFERIADLISLVHHEKLH